MKLWILDSKILFDKLLRKIYQSEFIVANEACHFLVDRLLRQKITPPLWYLVVKLTVGELSQCLDCADILAVGLRIAIGFVASSLGNIIVASTTEDSKDVGCLSC